MVWTSKLLIGEVRIRERGSTTGPEDGAIPHPGAMPTPARWTILADTQSLTAVLVVWANLQRERYVILGERKGRTLARDDSTPLAKGARETYVR